MLRSYFLAITLSLGLLAPAISSAAAGKDPYKYFFNETWGDFQEELANAKEQNKKGILIFFEMDECPYCHYMKNKVLNQPQVQDYYREHFKIFSVDIEGDVEITDFTGETMKMKDFAFKKNRVRATPVFAFYDLTGKQIHKHIGKTSSIEDFMLMGKYIAEGVYKDKKMRFSKYKRQQKAIKK